MRRRKLAPLAVWFAVYMALFIFLEIRPPEQVFIVHCGLDDWIPHIPAFIYPYLSWFPYICVCAFLAMRNLSDEDYVWALRLLQTGMTIFLIGCFVFPTGLNLREGIAYDMAALSGRLMQFVQAVDAPKCVFPSMHVYVTLVLQYSLELQKKTLPMWGVWLGRIVAAAIVLSTMFTKQHSALDVLGALVMFAALLLGIQMLRRSHKE